MTGVLFDLDGVLIDSETIYTKFWEEIDNIYPTGVKDFAYIIKGNNLAKILNTYYPDKELQKTIVKMIDDFEDKMVYEIFPGVIEFLTELKNASIPMAIVTSSDIKKMNKLFASHPDFESYFDAIVTGNMVKHSKPDPECFLKGAEMIGCNPKDCIIFEDSPSGILAALATGGKVIALATTLRLEDINKEAHKIIKSFAGFHINDMLEISKL